MKTLSGTFAFVALTVIASVTLPSCCRKQVSEEDRAEQKFVLRFGKLHTEPYFEVDKNAFDAALCALKKNHEHNKGDFNVEFKENAEARPDDTYDPPCPQVGLNTDRITTSGVARTEPAEESGGYDPHAVYRVRSNSLKEVKDVLDALKLTPTPTPH